MSGPGYTIRKALLLNMMSKDLGLQPIKARVDNLDLFFEL